MTFRGTVVGAGFFASNHLAAWREVSGAEIVALCDRDADKAHSLAARFGIPRTYTDAAAMLRAERPDFLDIITTVEAHAALVGLSAAHGVPVICQKPFARDLAEARGMVEACAQAGVPLMVHENFRWQSPLMAAKSVLDSGEIGTAEVARIHFRHGYDIYAGQPYLLGEERLAIMDIGIHLLDVARWLFGDVARLSCATQRIDPRVRGEDGVSLLLHHAGGTLNFVDFCFVTTVVPDPFPQTLLRIDGSGGSLTLDAGYVLTVDTPQGQRRQAVEPVVPPWGAKPWHNIQESVCTVQQHWVDSLRAGRMPATSGSDNLGVLQLVELAYRSAAMGRPLPVGAAA
jgi:predicted dehydrogenase